ncbi:hypothetical protein [Sunxiuqinia dokdonensis]|uniref:Uncharacterized protein n=1 Tax=Sunxiuqinia dokdonensis TaxID=1409788 RepID=A0A0L8V5H1_9BACT|nr:hypothetical protein [Sunxiuqinia dokdonensis]KOH43674.1 hypothetical protein NC99_35940 [Sunxiuqinia dokdonensis]
MTKITYKIGQLVAIRNHPYFEIPREGHNKNNSEIKYIGSTITCSSDNYPLMIVKEYTQSIEKKMEANSEDSTFKEVSKLRTNYLCAWYDSKLGRFQEAWFYSESLIAFPGISEVMKDSDFKDKSKLPIEVFLRTSIIERYKTIKNQARENDRFVSSSFIIKEAKAESQSEWRNEKYNFTEKLISKTKVKVQWFNVAKGKYSEEWLPIEFFKATPDLAKKEWKYIINDDRNFDTYTSTRLMDLLNSSNQSYFIQNNLSGQNLESLIFYYLDNSKKVILDERTHAFDEYLKTNNYEIVEFNVSVNSKGVDRFESFYAPVDIILKKKSSDESFAIDLISGNSLINDGQITSELKPLSGNFQAGAENERSNGICEEISLYNGRAYIIQELLKEKYDRKNIKSKLLIINNKLNNIIKEFDVVECPVSLGKVAK